MSKFAYQPVSEEYADQTLPGQLIINEYNGHISYNKNGIIISITKEIEDKIEDVVEIRHDIEEQEDVILSLISDYNDFIDRFKVLTANHNTLIDNIDIMVEKKNYIVKVYNNMLAKIARIREIIHDLSSANDLQRTRLSDYQQKVTALLPQIDIQDYITEQRNNINNLKANLKAQYDSEDHGSID